MILLTKYNVIYFDITTEVFMSPGWDITRLTMVSNFCTFYRRTNPFSVLYVVFVTYYVLMALLHNELEEETSFALQKRYLNILP